MGEYGDAQMMSVESCIEKIMKVDSLEAATVDQEGNPQVRVVSARYFEGTTMYFLTARGKAFARQLAQHPNIAFIAFDEPANDFVRLTGKVERIPDEEQEHYRTEMYKRQPYLENVYPGDSKEIDVMFRIPAYTLEYFTLKTHPITREFFEVGDVKRYPKGYFITDQCIGCATCQSVCPQNVITEGTPFVIDQHHCLQCGNCFENCPVQAIEWQGME